jgi:hypothetical protein
MAPGLVAKPRQPGALRFSQMPLDAFRRHAAIDAEQPESVKQSSQTRSRQNKSPAEAGLLDSLEAAA